MRPKARRSRACNQCRERRVKCDETPEWCNQCRRLGLECSGPLQGSVIIDMTPNVSQNPPRKRREPDFRATTPISEMPASRRPSLQLEVTPNAGGLGPTATAAFPRRTSIQVGSAGQGNTGQNSLFSAMQSRYKIPMVYEPSLVDTYDQAFISHFVELHTRIRGKRKVTDIFDQLPQLHFRSTQPALKYSIRAASMAFYARLHTDAAVMTDSYRWYITSLNRQRMTLANLQTQSPDEEHVLVPIILGLYEVYAGTTPMNVFQHLSGASKILEMRGPRNCASGNAHQLLKAMRVSDAHKCLIFNQTSVFASQEWVTLPYVVHPKNVHHQLIDIVLAIPPCIALCRFSGPLDVFFSRHIPFDFDLTPARQQTSKLINDVDAWAFRYPEHCTVTPLTDSSETPVTPPNDPLLPTSPSPANAVPFNVLTSSTYHAARLVLTLLHHKISPAATSSASEQEPAPAAMRPAAIPPLAILQGALSHATSILQNCSYLERTHPLGFDFMRSVFPLVVVASIAPRAQERKMAKETLQRWGAMRGVGGLCGPWTVG